MKTSRQWISFIYLSGLSLTLSACGGGPTGENANLEANSSSEMTTEIFSRGGFQPHGLQVQAGDKLIITSTGLWTGGQLACSGVNNHNCTPAWSGAEGSEGTGIISASGNTAPFFSYAKCGMSAALPAGVSLPAGVTPDSSGFYDGVSLYLDQNGNIMNTATAGGYNVTVPSGNTQRCCEPDKYIILNFFAGNVNNWIKNECAPVARNRLIMKIVPKGGKQEDFRVIDIGKDYEQNPYTATSTGILHFASNDLIRGKQDNSGSLMVTVKIIK